LPLQPSVESQFLHIAGSSSILEYYYCIFRLCLTSCFFNSPGWARSPEENLWAIWQ